MHLSPFTDVGEVPRKKDGFPEEGWLRGYKYVYDSVWQWTPAAAG